MNIHPVAKGLIGLGIAGGIAGGGYALFPSNTKNVIAEKLIRDKYTILTSDSRNSSHWDAILSSYKATTTPSNLKFNGFTGNESGAKERLQELCSELLKPSSETSLDTNKYQKAEKWCVEPITISKILEERGTTILNMDIANKTKDQDNWQGKIRLHRGDQHTNKRIANLSVGTDGEISEQHISDIKTKCKEIGNKKNHEDKYDENLASFKLWCANT